jgi:type I restriction enzyme M protein
MLDTDTKRRIDTARDILVGKVPDPKSQVEQITIALIYKFMDDMDAESEGMGGVRTFFTGEFARYGWQQLMHSGLGGHETLALYADGIDKMPKNPGIPALFRDIFKNAYLPYRDPETLRAFLKIIDEFSYDHSERLGDAFEYLLSVLGSQGDAGQFRTPRHIIDFMVEVLKPQKHEVILDPACGTAGFLISAYKHILRNNQDAKGKSTLTPDDRAGLAKNFKGYDISPDMVRLSLVNLYLHGFTDPHIYEYDTLTQEDRWNELADVILANPPFMSPKGGIKPHKRFSIDAKRSEVLFVDYMAEHLTAKGRAGIIVPEGIIFQSQTSYKALRKMLVDEALVAVVSLPAGCFNPYSGVKTSILILDKSIAKQSDSIAFFKVVNDGFGLGAQRREIGKNDLPQVKLEIEAYLQALREGAATDALVLSTGHVVSKEKIAANGDYSLSGERYREGSAKSSVFPLVRIGDVCTINPRKSQIAETPETRVSFVPMADLNEYRISFRPADDKTLSEVSSSYTYFQNEDVLLAKVTPCFENGKAGIARDLLNGIGFGSSEFYVLRSNGQVLPEWIYFCVMHQRFRSSAIAQMTGTGGLQRVPRDYVENFEIPQPPLDVQKEIVAEIESYQKVIDGARAVLDHYRPHIPIDSDWPMVGLGEVCDVRDGTHDSPKYVLEGYPLITSKNLKDGFIDFTDVNLISRADLDAINKRSKVDEGDLLMPMIGTIGNPVIADASREYAVKNVALIKFPDNCKVDNRFLKDLLDSAAMQDRFQRQASGSTQKFIPLGFIRKLEIPLPPLATQRVIVAEIEAEQALVAANRELIARFEQKIQAALARIWGEEPSSTPEL